METEIADTRRSSRTSRPSTRRTPRSIANSLREIQKFQRKFEAVKAKVAVGGSLEKFAGMMKGSISELQGMIGG